MSDDIEIDARNMLCPLPVLKLRKQIKDAAPGTVFRLLTTDPAALIDVPHYCFESGHVLIDTHDADGVAAYRVRKS